MQMSVYMIYTDIHMCKCLCTWCLHIHLVILSLARALSHARSLQPQHPRDRLVSLFLPFLSKKQKKKVFTPWANAPKKYLHKTKPWTELWKKWGNSARNNHYLQKIRLPQWKFHGMYILKKGNVYLKKENPPSTVEVSWYVYYVCTLCMYIMYVSYMMDVDYVCMVYSGCFMVCILFMYVCILFMHVCMLCMYVCMLCMFVIQWMFHVMYIMYECHSCIHNLQ